MANPSRGEVDFSFLLDGEEQSYTLKFSNAGRRAMEDELAMEAPEINAKIDAGQIGPRILSALLYGATRKFHARALPTMMAIDNLMDDIDEASQENAEVGTDLFASLASAYLRTDKKVILERMKGEEPEPEEDPKEDPKEEPKAKAETKAKSKQPRSEAGEDS